MSFKKPGESHKEKMLRKKSKRQWRVEVHLMPYHERVGAKL